MTSLDTATLDQIVIRDETPADMVAREALLDRTMPNRSLKTSERLREGRLPARGLSLVAEADGALVGTVRLWHVCAGPGRPALLLGPLAVAPERQGDGVGGALMREAIARAEALGHGAILLVGDAPYYARFGFAAAPTASLWLPGPHARERFLALELRRDALAGAAGLVSPTGERAPAPALADLVTAASRTSATIRAA
jgi:predicted N-acetyltransferase YhbS